MRDEELEIRNEELGINVVGPTERVFLYGAVPTTDGVWPFRAQYGAWSGDWECAWLELLTH